MNLQHLGLNSFYESLVVQDNKPDLSIGRVMVEHKERYLVQTADGTYQSEITGNLRYSSSDASDFPTVGDWVYLNIIDKSLAIIVQILPRQNTLKRQAIGKSSAQQIIASNIDAAFIVQAMGHDFNLNRLERYLSICNASDIVPIIIVNKTDLFSQEEQDLIANQLHSRIKDVQTIFYSNVTLKGTEELLSRMEMGKTYCVLGSSGVGKSSLINTLLEQDVMQTKEISEATSKGKHTTSHRELFLLKTGGVIIDTPGMRELGMADNKESIALTFEEIDALAQDCRFNDCSHTSEKGCAILEALDNDQLDETQLDNYHKLMREQAHYDSSVHEKREKDKQFGKMVKTILNQKKRNK